MKTKFPFFIIFLLLIFPNYVFAVRPFITDDARINLKDEFLIETSLRVDSERFQNLNVLTYGLGHNLETSINFTDGFMNENKKFSVAGPGFQAKYIWGDGISIKTPSVALTIGATSPNGSGNPDFKSNYWSEYLYFCISKALVNNPENFNIHINLGINRSDGPETRYSSLWGIGFQIHTIGKLFLCTEIFSGDPYAITPGALYQVGFRYFISNNIQFDSSTGIGLYGDPKLGPYLGLGLRILFN